MTDAEKCPFANCSMCRTGQFADKTLRELQTTLPWTIRYSRDFRANPQPHKDFSHALLHVAKALGHLTELADDMDHDREVADDPTLKERHAKYLADLVVCALRAANTFPGGVVDLQAAVENRITAKNAPTPTEPRSDQPAGAPTPTEPRSDQPAGAPTPTEPRGDQPVGAPVVCTPYKADMPKFRFDCEECQAQRSNQDHKDHAPINPPFCDFCKNTGYLNGTGYCKCLLGVTLKATTYTHPELCNAVFSKFGFNNASIGFTCKRFKGHTGDHE